MGYKIKWRFLLKLSVVLILAGVSLHFIHRWQVRSQAGAFLHQADLARDAAKQAEEKNPPEPQVAREQREREQSFLQRYILARPADIDVRERLARRMAQNANSRGQAVNAYFVLEDVLRRDPDRYDLRRFTIEHAMNRLGFIREAKANLEFFLDPDPKRSKELEQYRTDGELRDWYAKCFLAERNLPKAREQFQIATNSPDPMRSETTQPDTIQVESYAYLASVLRQLNESKDADSTIGRMYCEHRGNFRAHLLASEYLRELGLEVLHFPVNEGGKEVTRTIERKKLIAEALRLAPNDIETLILSAGLALEQRRGLMQSATGSIAEQAAKLKEARELLTRALELHKESPKAYLAMAALEDDVRQLDDAIKVIQSGLSRDTLTESAPLLSRLLDYQFRKGDAAAAAETLKRLHAVGLTPGDEELASARVLMLHEKWKDAAAELERTITLLSSDPAKVRKVHSLLGRCYAELGDHEKRLNAFTLALPNEVRSLEWIEAMVGVAESQAALDRLEDAVKTYRRMTDFTPGVWVPIARLELLRELRQPSDKRDWKEVKAALASADVAAEREGGRFIPDTTDLKILQATVMYHDGKANKDDGKSKKARELLEELRNEQPKNVTPRTELAMQALREEQFTEAHQILDAAVKDLGDSAEVRIARAHVWAAMKPNDLNARFTELADAPTTFTSAQKRRLLRGLAGIASGAGAQEAADKLWDQLAIARPFDLGVQLVRFERASRAGNLAAMEAIVAQIRQHEVEHGQFAKLTHAIFLIQRSQKENRREDRDVALKLLDEIEFKQGNSTPARVLMYQGVIHDLNGNRDVAKAKYRQSMERGETSLVAVRRLFELLSSSRDETEIKEASLLLGKLENAPNLGPDFQRLAAAVSLRFGQAEEAIGHASKAVSKDSSNYKDQLWLGHIYWRSKQSKESPEDRFREAIKLAPEEMETWLTLIQYLLATANKSKAAEEFEKAREKVKPADRALLSALGQAQLGETDKALESFKRAREERPTDVRILLAEADLCFRASKLVEAREGYQRILNLASASSDEKALASQKLALVIAMDARPEVAAEALKLLPSARGENETPAQKRYRAVILGLQKSSENLKTAIRLLEENRAGSNASERFFLAQLYSSVGHRTGVPLIMEELLQSESNRNPLFLRFYIRWLIREGDLGRATERVTQLVKVDPDSLGTAEMKARLAAARKDPGAARDALRLQAERPGAPLNVIAGICEEIELFDEAERLWKRFVSENQKANPRAILAEAKFHGRRGRTEEGLRICEEMHGKLPLQIVADVAINVLYNAQSPSNTQLEKVAGWLDAALPKAAGPEKNTLLQLMAAIRNLQGKYEDAAACYKRILNPQEGGNPEDPLALNNLAYLLSTLDKQLADSRKSSPDQKTQMEALEMINRAKKVLGDHVVLLDTEALIWLNAGQAARALPLMEDVVARAPSGTALYHLAQVKHALKPGDVEVRLHWRRALELGLKSGDLHPLERKDYDINMSAWN